MLLRELPLEGETCRRRGSMKGVKEEEDLCFCMVLLAEWVWRQRHGSESRTQTNNSGQIEECWVLIFVLF
jgi:hypothetical protein